METNQINMQDKKMEPIPEVGKEYHFFDDGKTSLGRHYICRCENVITLEEAKKIKFKLIDFDNDEKKYEDTLYNIWRKRVVDYYWLMSDETDFFVEISCPEYDQNRLWAARTRDGGWFTLDIQSFWQGGRIDVTGDVFHEVLEFWRNEGENDMVEAYKSQKY